MENLSVVVITRNQATHISKMREAVWKQLHIAPYFVLDRCDDGSKKILTDLDYVSYTVRDDAIVGFCAGSARNLGLRHVSESDDVLFLDGDRIPHGLTTDLVKTALSRYDITMIRSEKDNREWFSDDFSSNIAGDAYFINDVYSSAILVSRKSIKAIQRIQQGHLFHPAFDGIWGAEDNFLGCVASLLGLRIGGFPKSVYVEGQVNVLTDNLDGFEIQRQIYTAMRQKVIYILRQLDEYNGPEDELPDYGTYYQEAGVDISTESDREYLANLFKPGNGFPKVSEENADQPAKDNESADATPEEPSELESTAVVVEPADESEIQLKLPL